MSPLDFGHRMSRRRFLAAAAGAAAAPALPGLLDPSVANVMAAPTVRRFLDRSVQEPSASDLSLDVLTNRPLNAQAPIAALRSWRTPNELFYVRSSLGPPAQVPQQWTLTIDGEVERELVLSLDDIQALPSVSRPVVLECAGNGRGRLDLANTSGIHPALAAALEAAERDAIDQLPPGPGKDVVSGTCMTCHETAIIQQQRKDRDAWRRSVQRMIEWGAQLSAEQEETAIDYLSAHFGPER